MALVMITTWNASEEETRQFPKPPSSHPPRWSCPAELQPVPLAEQRKRRCRERVGCWIDAAGVCTLWCPGAPSQPAGTTRALRPSPASQRSPSIWLRTRSPRLGELRAPRLVRVTCGPGRTPPSALGLLRPFPHAPCPAGDSAGHWRCPGRARPGWRRGETQAPAPARVRSSLSLSICPTGPLRGGGLKENFPEPFAASYGCEVSVTLAMKYRRNPMLPLERGLISCLKGKNKRVPPLFLAFWNSESVSKGELAILSL
ncbi:uncharacterized protein LOC128098742 [Peromyscus californicus insignis]|uniref:uncharacterized protein LOC128098742 n=1 Tax=Peromyscus californicus insignis TaxID=564181 RepID=UPI0022A7856F|nr:uncharacterized protein LOC128098742 [Peromyscus californicus insignis]